MEMLNKNILLLLGLKKYTLTVVTSPASATCTLTYRGKTYNTKTLEIRKGETVSYSIHHSTYGTTTGTILMDSNKTLTCVGKQERKYYKYVNETWTTPNLTSATSYGTITPSGSQYTVFNGGTLVISWSTGKDDNSSYNVTWEFPYEVTFNSVSYKPMYAYNAYFAIKKFRLDVWQNNGWVNVYSKTDIPNDRASAITSSVTPISTSKIRIRLSAVYVSTCNSRVGDIYFGGQVKDKPQESTQYDYDYYVDTYNYYWSKTITSN